ncbi:hypothetical protein B0H11DRAFT_1907612 [Mycena galericulata]|nr:hypothetical protein B0H11DRAFT_1907612 [Mycena galericulata]
MPAYLKPHFRGYRDRLSLEIRRIRLNWVKSALSACSANTVSANLSMDSEGLGMAFPESASQSPKEANFPFIPRTRPTEAETILRVVEFGDAVGVPGARELVGMEQRQGRAVVGHISNRQRKTGRISVQRYAGAVSSTMPGANKALLRSEVVGREARTAKADLVGVAMEERRAWLQMQSSPRRKMSSSDGAMQESSGAQCGLCADRRACTPVRGCTISLEAVRPPRHGGHCAALGIARHFNAAYKSSRQPPADFFVTVAPVDVGIIGVINAKLSEPQKIK